MKRSLLGFAIAGATLGLVVLNASAMARPNWACVTATRAASNPGAMGTSWPARPGSAEGRRLTALCCWASGAPPCLRWTRGREAPSRHENAHS